MNGIDIIKYLESMYPKELAYEWDNVGLQVGSLNKNVKKVLITLDVTKEVVKEAISKQVDLLISHHPLIFKPIYNIQVESPRGWMIQKLIKHDIPLYTMHTNYDVADGGMNDFLAKRLGIIEPTLLDTADEIGRFGKVTPKSLEETISFVKQALHAPHVRLIGTTSKQIRSIGISGGSGASHIAQAKRNDCDLYITGDVTYHSALDAIQMGQVVLDVGHHIEVIFMEAISDQIKEHFSELEVMISAINTDPYTQL
jgi:GTP cyclohydrolase I